MKYSAVLFDMNGVIVDDEDLHEAAFQQVLINKGFHFDHNKYIDFFAGKTDQAGFLDFYKYENKNLKDVNILIQKKALVYQQLASKKLTPYPGVLDYIKKLNKAGLKLALVTSSIRLEAEAVLKAFELSNIFQVIITANEITKSKPNPEGYLKGVAALEVPPQECFIVEDAPSGVAAAKAAGIKCLAITNTHTSKDLKDAQLIVKNLDSNMIFP